MRKLSENNTRKLLRLGKTSLAVTLPKDILDDLGWREKQRVVIEQKGKTIVICDWPAKQ